MLVKKITTGVVTAVVSVALFSGVAFADASIVVMDNGADSTNKVYVSDASSTSVYQGNTSETFNGVSSVASTGGNKANSNTGGDTTIDTGDATSDVLIKNHGSSNTANVNPCGCEQNGGLDIVVDHNGADSYNKVKVHSSDSTRVKQKNTTIVVNEVYSKAKTGKNRASRNTGGSVDILTGNADSLVTVKNWAPTNTLN